LELNINSQTETIILNQGNIVNIEKSVMISGLMIQVLGLSGYGDLSNPGPSGWVQIKKT